MTEQEAIELLQNLNVKLTDMSGHETNGIEKIFGWDEITAICEAIKALEEVQQYRAIGTPKECRRENMKAEQIMEVVDKLVGEIKPIGDSNYDDKVKDNLKTMIDIVGYYVDEICEIAEMNSYCASIQDCSAIARDFINGLKDAYESLNYTY